MNNQHFAYFDRYAGMLYDDARSEHPTRVYGLENVTDGKQQYLALPADGAVFGYVATGGAEVTDNLGTAALDAGMWFALPDGGTILARCDGTRVVAVQRLGYRGMRSFGGPVERFGRLRYIDGCSDSLLASPPLRGDPCLNHLHFPKGIDQTEHTHPSIRVGMVARGFGECITPLGRCDLFPGRLFVIPKDGLHRFATLRGTSMDVIAYHPETDWGPTHEEHPMVNKTLVDGAKIDNTQGRHLAVTEIERGAK